jgi:hypothetical protein
MMLSTARLFWALITAYFIIFWGIFINLFGHVYVRLCYESLKPWEKGRQIGPKMAQVTAASFPFKSPSVALPVSAKTLERHAKVSTVWPPQKKKTIKLAICETS